MASYVSSFLGQAQNVVQSSSLGEKLHIGHHRPGSPSAQSTNTTAPSSSTTHKSSALTSIGHQFRTLKQQYGDSSPYQRLVTTLKGLVIDHDNVAKDAKAASKELYMWGQTESDDLKDGGCTLIMGGPIR